MQLDFFEDAITQFKNEHEDFVECATCKKEKPISSFYKQSNVSSKTGQSWYHKNCKECFIKEQTFRNNTTHKYEDKKKETCDCCGIKTEKLNFDHDHKTNDFRGWLCAQCNTGIGKLGDNIEGVKKALEYLKRHYETTERS